MAERIGGEVRRQLDRFDGGGIARIVAVWPAAVGAEIARNAWPARIARDGTLHVSVSSSTWAFELTQLEQTIRTRLGEALEQPLPRLRFAPGLIPEVRAEDEPNAAPPPRIEPRAEDLARADEIAATVSDENLRKVVARAAAMSLARAADGRPVW